MDFFSSQGRKTAALEKLPVVSAVAVLVAEGVDASAGLEFKARSFLSFEYIDSIPGTSVAQNKLIHFSHVPTICNFHCEEDTCTL